MDVWMYGCMDVCIHGWMDGWMCGCMDVGIVCIVCMYCEMNTYTDLQRQHDNIYCRLPFHTCQGSITNLHPAVLQTRGCGQPWVEAGAVCLSHKASRSRTITFLCCGQQPISSSSEILTWHSSGGHKTRSVTLVLGLELSAVTVLWFWLELSGPYLCEPHSHW